ncbi:MAG: glutamate 5-kinase [Dehalococcoidia bacterium]|jgi:glutamate 5-kinase|nr:glutamate 5-kinase [Dehalococcoidia bacterium]
MVAPLSPRYRRVVAKVGTNVLTAGGDRLDLEVMASLVGQVARLREQGVQVAMVSSGAIAAGRHRLGVKGEARDVPQRQVLAAVGQPDLMYAYQQLFAWHGITIAQTLLSRRDLSDRQGYLNARNTLMALLQLGVVPIVNENDVVAVEEIEGAAIGDNDTLSALVANLVDADLLVILTDTDGLYTADPYLDPQAQLIRRVERIDAEVERLAGASHGPGRGGMITKVQAARLATASGTHVVIANGHSRDVLVRVVAGEEVGTLFPAAIDRLESRKRWMLSGLSWRGRIVIDEGAVKALRGGKASLLPAGVVGTAGDFQRGDVVAIVDAQGQQVACGIANYSAQEVEAIKGLRSDRIAELLGYTYGQEVVHRDNLVLM